MEIKDLALRPERSVFRELLSHIDSLNEEMAILKKDNETLIYNTSVFYQHIEIK